MNVAAVHRVEYYGPGDAAQGPFRPGDLILTHGEGWASALIRFGQGLRFRGPDRPYARWNHAAIVVDGGGGIAEALEWGVEYEHVSKYEGKEYALVRLETSEERRAGMLAFAKSVLRTRPRYGYVTILCIALQLLFASGFVFARSGTAICSGFAAEVLIRNHEIFGKEPLVIMPADLARHFGVGAGEP